MDANRTLTDADLRAIEALIDRKLKPIQSQLNRVEAKVYALSDLSVTSFAALGVRAAQQDKARGTEHA